MTRIAISGHRGLPAGTEALVEAEVRAEVAKRAGGELVGISCIADGPDSIFARSILENGGALIVVVPAREYRASLPVEHHRVYDELHSAADEIVNLDREMSDSEAHQAGSVRMLDIADELLAVWDGKPARGYGGTADVVAVARERGMPVTVIWPAGAQRDS